MRRDAPEAFFAKQDSTGEHSARNSSGWIRDQNLRSALPEGEQLVEETWALGRKWEQLDQRGDASLKGIAQQWKRTGSISTPPPSPSQADAFAFRLHGILRNRPGKPWLRFRRRTELEEQIGERINRFLRRLPRRTGISPRKLGADPNQ